jgi:MFS family permease
MKHRKKISQVTLESLALLLATIAALVAASWTYVVTMPMAANLSNITHYGPYAAVLVSVAVVIAFMVGYINSDAYQQGKGWRKLQQVALSLLLAIAHGAIAYLLVAALSSLAGTNLDGITILPSGAITVSALLAGTAAYIMYLYASAMSAQKLAGFLAVFMMAGGIGSMIVAEDKNWWHIHISALGAGGETLSSQAFNLTLITGGILIIGLAHYIATELRQVQQDNHEQLQKNRITVVKVAFFLIGAAMLIAGAFPYDRVRWLHDLGANTMSYVFCLIAVGLPFLVPVFSKTFTVFSILTVLAVWIASLLSYFRTITLLQMEFFAALCFFGWLIVLVRTISAVAADRSHSGE